MRLNERSFLCGMRAALFFNLSYGDSVNSPVIRNAGWRENSLMGVLVVIARFFGSKVR
jgi:hypothetical protein